MLLLSEHLISLAHFRDSMILEFSELGCFNRAFFHARGAPVAPWNRVQKFSHLEETSFLSRTF